MPYRSRIKSRIEKVVRWSLAGHLLICETQTWPVWQNTSCRARIHTWTQLAWQRGKQTATRLGTRLQLQMHLFSAYISVIDYNIIYWRWTSVRGSAMHVAEWCAVTILIKTPRLNFNQTSSQPDRNTGSFVNFFLFFRVLGSAGGDQSGLAGVGGAVARARAGRRRTGPPPPHNGAHEPHQNNNNNNNNNTLHPTIKNERLSPHAATDRSSSRYCKFNC